MRILIADDHARLRRGLADILTEAFGGVEIGEAADVPEAVRLLRRRRWDVVILDINMPGGSGFDVLRRIRRKRVRPAVLILSLHAEDTYALRALRGGAAGYMTKDRAAHDLVAAVRALLAGGRWPPHTR